MESNNVVKFNEKQKSPAELLALMVERQDDIEDLFMIATVKTAKDETTVMFDWSRLKRSRLAYYFLIIEEQLKGIILGGKQ